jgi:RNA polymerase sigma-70 factor, ECF subfamily
MRGLSVSEGGGGRWALQSNTKIWRHFLRNHAQLRSYIQSLVSNQADAADLLQEVGLVILDHQGVPADARQFSAWCRGIARNVVSHHWRSARRHSELFSPADFDSEPPDSGIRSTEDIVASRTALEACLQDLDDHSRLLLTLRYMDGETSGEIARQFRQTPAAIRMKIMRVRDALKERMKG